MKRTLLVSAAITFAAMVGCMEEASPDPEPYVPPGAGVDAGGGTPGGGTPGGGTPGGGTPGGGTPGGGTPDAGGTPGGGDTDAAVGTDAGGGTPGGGAWTPGPAYNAVVGSGPSCSTYGEAMNGMCAGAYCGVTEAMVTAAFAELPPDSVCRTLPAALACDGLVARTVSICARREKSNPFNLGLSNAQLRPIIEKCVYDEEATIKAQVEPACLSCYLDSAECSGDNCLVECLGGDSADCDKCRLDKGCSRPVADCTGFPNPLAPL